MNKAPVVSNGTNEPLISWFRYGAEAITIFFALAVLAGRAYILSYWNVFGLPLESTDTAFINYAIVSPNTALASVFLAIGTVAMFTFFRQQPYDLVGNASPTVAYFLGWLAFWLGLTAIGLIPRLDLSSWTTGTVGLAFGLAYLLAVWGQVTWMQATLQRQKELSRMDKIIFGWLRKLPVAAIQLFFVLVLVSVGLWAILDTAQKFGANDAKMMVLSRPDATLHLDSPKGFEDLAVSNPAGVTLLTVRIITEAGGFLYVVSGASMTPPQLNIRAIPVSRIQAIRYAVGITPLGK